MRVIGVDEHVWRHTPYGDKFVTVILDLTPIRDQSGPSRLLDMVPGRSKKVFKTWLASQPHTWRERIEIVAMGWIHRVQKRRRRRTPRRKGGHGSLPRRTPRWQRLG